MVVGTLLDEHRTVMLTEAASVNETLALQGEKLPSV